ncbi:extracellular solute-binding protein [Bifidobacterium sp. ESL0690]|uniref:ABC transporter substrate-binding protein n=1 Tax=Bifidobacterium sp. ESL0690 TaxID=2983214 RepID=UPI0023F7044A|nr:extracellular solute-binding protein [Bifidobacterium sp. ESL0690]WEV46631.1 extracellular solute-binding protein [Bifidobacterium sp. ESL0690]
MLRKKAIKCVALVASIAMAIPMMAGCGGNSADGKEHIQFFQKKPESVKITNKLIKEFEAQNPNITVEQQTASNPITVLKSRMAKNDVPDVITADGTYYNDLVKANILTEQTGTTAYKSVANKSYYDYLHKIGQTKKNYVVPWSIIGEGVLYNKDIFTKLGLTAPTTWDEFVQTAQKVKDAGQQPFIFTWKDADPANKMAMAVAAPEQGKDFWDNLQKGKASFAKNPGWKLSADRMLKLKTFAQEDPAGTDYDTGNSQFANGKSAMYIQGIWAIPAILEANPNIHLGFFVLPTRDQPNTTPLISGTDALIGVSSASKHQKAAQKFLTFLLSKKIQKEYTDDQNLLSVRSDVPANTDVLKAMKADYIDKGKTCIFPDVMFTGASDMQGLSQEFLEKGDVNAYLNALDADFQKNGIK